MTVTVMFCTYSCLHVYMYFFSSTLYFAHWGSTSAAAAAPHAGGDGHQPHGVVPAQQPGQLLQPAPGEQGARGGREQRGRVVAQEASQGTSRRWLFTKTGKPETNNLYRVKHLCHLL